ncbi:LacI family DNA-binding transcriptional regulator [Bacillus sp. 28A-2]|uniref:LacI family DNA-binding transcriptional regulator n=1 Tax=Bacillus sp. 28A-2 TaxID=2772252 RepID=UPI00168D238B|nr:LacI family DNA-binding transcriptional regulator [Bacillus sp. 28A-2]MBD3861620.1 LacI family DNA-binding transcriptional regulator [Bacillus sp. 28A-2]
MKKNAYTKVNSSDVARYAGVSQSTVSRVFTPNPEKKVSDSIRLRVMDAANKLGYHPNALARGLIMNKTNMIGVVMGDIENPFFSAMLENLTELLKDKGFQILFVYTKNGLIQENEIMQFVEYKVDGIIVTDALLHSNFVNQLEKFNIPVVLLYRNITNSSCHYVGMDNYNAGKQIAHFLFKLGHKHFAYLKGHHQTSTNFERQKGFTDFLNEHSIQPIIEAGGYSYSSGYDAALSLLSKSPSIDALFCADDIMAIGVLDAAKSLHINVPEDLSIIGFDDIPMANWPPYSLTTWKVPLEELVQIAVETLVSCVGGTLLTPKNTLLTGKLVVRNSTAKNR